MGVIQDYCLEEKLPPLTILLVNQHGRPGEGFIAWDVDDLDEGYRPRYGLIPGASSAIPSAFADAGERHRTAWPGISSGSHKSRPWYGAESRTAASPRMCSAARC